MNKYEVLGVVGEGKWFYILILVYCLHRNDIKIGLWALRVLCIDCFGMQNEDLSGANSC